MQTENWIEQGNVFKTCLKVSTKHLFLGGQHQDVRLCRQSIDCSSLLRLLIEIEKAWFEARLRSLLVDTQYYSGTKRYNWIKLSLIYIFLHLAIYYCIIFMLIFKRENRRLQEDNAIVRLFCLSYLLLWKRCTRNAKTRKPPRLLCLI